MSHQLVLCCLTGKLDTSYTGSGATTKARSNNDVRGSSRVPTVWNGCSSGLRATRSATGIQMTNQTVNLKSIEYPVVGRIDQ